MNLFHKTSAITFSIDDSLYKIYRDGESAEFVVASINGPMVDFDDEEAA